MAVIYAIWPVTLCVIFVGLSPGDTAFSTSPVVAQVSVSTENPVESSTSRDPGHNSSGGVQSTEAEGIPHHHTTERAYTRRAEDYQYPYDDYPYDDYEYEDDVGDLEATQAYRLTTMPVVQPTEVTVKLGDQVSLPCDLHASDEGGVTWTHEGRLLFVGSSRSVKDLRYSLRPEEGPEDHISSSLHISRAGVSDRGTYTCHSITNPTAPPARYRLNVLVPPQVTIAPEGEVMVVEKGRPVVLSCHASGVPQPEVFWRKKEGVLPYGDQVLREPVLRIASADSTHTGIYICSTVRTDPQQQQGNASKRLEVNFAPLVRALHSVVHSGEGHEAWMSCEIQAQPPPQVTWSRADGRSLTPGHHVTSRRGDIHSLEIDRVQSEDLGTYLCTATNKKGTNMSFVQLTGRPTAAVVTSSDQRTNQKTRTLHWQGESYAPVLTYKLLYRPKALPPARDPEDSEQISVEEFDREEGGVRMRMQPSWMEVVISPETLAKVSRSVRYHHQYSISDLLPNAEYEALVLAENKYGWSEVSKPFSFTTYNDAEDEAQLYAQTGQNTGRRRQDDGDSAASLNMCVVTVIAALIASLLCT